MQITIDLNKQEIERVREMAQKKIRIGFVFDEHTSIWEKIIRAVIKKDLTNPETRKLES